MKKFIALTLLFMFLISSACIASPYIAYVDTSDDREWEQSVRDEWKEYREERAQERAEANDVERVRKILEERKQKTKKSPAKHVYRQKKEEQAQQAQLGIDFDKLRSELKEKNRQRYSGLNQYQQTKEQEQEIAIRVEQARQERQKIFLLLGIASIITFAILFIKRKIIFRWLTTVYKTITPLQISQIFLILFLLIVTTDRFSSGVYTLLRILTTTISVWSAMKTDNNILKLIFAFIAILFNPIILIELDRDEWQVIDIATAIFYLGIVIRSLTNKK